MNKLFATTAVLLLSSISHADIIKCNFTEPFVDTAYSTTQSTLTYTDVAMKQKNVIKNVSLQIKGAGLFELVDSNGKVIQTLKLNNQGSDGMSNVVYPYDVKDARLEKMANNGYGGCSSNHLKATDPDENY